MFNKWNMSAHRLLVTECAYQNSQTKLALVNYLDSCDWQAVRCILSDDLHWSCPWEGGNKEWTKERWRCVSTPPLFVLQFAGNSQISTVFVDWNDKKMRISPLRTTAEQATAVKWIEYIILIYSVRFKCCQNQFCYINLVLEFIFILNSIQLVSSAQTCYLLVHTASFSKSWTIRIAYTNSINSSSIVTVSEAVVVLHFEYLLSVYLGFWKTLFCVDWKRCQSRREEEWI